MIINLMYFVQVPPEAAYTSLVSTPHRPLNVGERSPPFVIVSLFRRLPEHYYINPQLPIFTGGKHDGFDDGLENAWLPSLQMHENNVILSIFTTIMTPV